MLSPKPEPTIAASHNGVFLTLFFPNFSTKPSVILKAPPYSAISCPIKTKFGWFFMEISMASEIASMNLISLFCNFCGKIS